MLCFWKVIARSFLNPKRKLLKLEAQNFDEASLVESGAREKAMSFSALLYGGLSALLYGGLSC
jgi:hypothetical protein